MSLFCLKLQSKLSLYVFSFIVFIIIVPSFINYIFHMFCFVLFSLSYTKSNRPEACKTFRKTRVKKLQG